MSSILLIMVCALVGGFYAGSESGAYQLNRIRLRREASAGSRLASLLEHLVSDMERFLCVTLVATNVAFYCATIFCAGLLRTHFHSKFGAELASTLVLSPVLLVVSEIVPKSIFQARPNLLLRWTTPILWLSEILFWPVVKLLRAVNAFWQHLLGGRGGARGTVVTRQYLNFFLTEGTQEGVITSQHNLMARNIMQLSGRPVHKAMIPLARVRMVPLNASRNDVRHFISQYDHARLPVYEGDRSNVVGILLVLDYLCNGGDEDLATLTRTPVRLDTGLPLNDAFRRLQDAGQTVGVVVDARGRAVGMVTLGDLLQEIFGSLDAA